MPRTHSEHRASPPATTPPQRHPAARAARGAFAVLALAAGAAVAQPVPTAELDHLAAKSASAGSVRVIVGLNVATAPEGKLGRVAAVAQRANIRAAQNAAVGELMAASGAHVHALFDNVPHFAAEVDAAGLARLRASRLVKTVQEDVAVPPSLLQSTAQVNAQTAWDSGRTGSGWTVAVLDTGIDKTHPFLAGKVVSEACYSSTTSQSSSVCPGGVTSSVAAGSGVNCNTAISGCIHGTHVGGIVAGTGAADGSHGVARGANLIAIQVFSNFPSYGSVMSYTSDQIKGLERVYALRDTYQIASVNMSLGGGQYTSLCDSSQGALKAAIDNLRSVGIATVIASGNDGYRSAMSAPACISSAVSVGSQCDAGPDGSACATGVGGVASYSNIASFVSLLAPGSYITSSVPGTGYSTLQGTSMAAPHVAGAWALLKQAQPGISVDDGLSLMRANGVAVNDTRSGGVVSGMSRINLAFLAGNAYTMTVTKAGSGGGVVVSAPNGVNCGSDCVEPYSEGTSVTLNPTPSTGSTFAGWGGACSGAGTCTVTMTEARNVTATFNAIPYTLSVAKAGTGSGSVSSSPGGIDCGSTCSVAFNGGTSVSLAATPAAGSRFTGWSGACSGTGACTLAMTAARSVTATFAIQSYALAVTRDGTGTGTVSSSPSGIACGATCTATRTYGTVLTLSAVPASGTAFTGWGGACSGTGTCAVTFSEAKSVSATFTRTHNTLTVTKSGSGSVSSSAAGIDCGSTCTAQVAVDSTVTLTPTPLAGWRLSAWGGACTGSADCSVSMSAARSVSATFVRITYPLTVAKSGTGVGTVASSPAGISCGATCSVALNSGTGVTLTATPASGTVFAGWSGACSGTGTCAVTMSEARNVGAVFTRTHFALTVAKSGTGVGSITSSPAAINCGTACSALVAVDSSVTLTATPAAETNFVGWGGACTGTDACTVTMSDARNVTATFTRARYTLTVARSGTGVGSVSSSPSGIDCGSTCSQSIAVGSSVSLTPLAATGSRFASWGGACTGTGTCSVTMSTARSVTAMFTVLSFPVTVTKAGTGSGTVSSAPAGIACGATCTATRAYGSNLTLSAVPAAGSSFTGWSGACSGTGTCSLSVTDAQSVSASFTKTQHTLTAAKSGSGTITSSPAAITCGSACSALMAIDSDVSLTATPAAEMAFAGWSGACSGTGTCTVTMSDAKSVSASFVRTSYTLTVLRSGTGTGNVSSSPAAIDCDSACSSSIAIGTAVTLTPTATDGSRFVSWSGACTGSGACTVSMSAARSVTATFTRNIYLLSVTKNGSGTGTVSSSPAGIACGATCSRSLNSLTALTLTATASSGSTFAGWAGACSGTGTCAVTMSAAQSVAATFTKP